MGSWRGCGEVGLLDDVAVRLSRYPPSRDASHHQYTCLVSGIPINLHLPLASWEWRQPNAAREQHGCSAPSLGIFVDSSRDEKVWELPGEWYAFAKRGELVATHFLDFLGSFAICWIFFQLWRSRCWFLKHHFFWHFHLYQDQHQGRFDFHFLTIVHNFWNGVKWNHTSTRFRFYCRRHQKVGVFPENSWCGFWRSWTPI